LKRLIIVSIEFKPSNCQCKGVRITDQQLDRLSVDAEQKANSRHPGLPLGVVPNQVFSHKLFGQTEIQKERIP